MINIAGLDFGNSKCIFSVPKENGVYIELNSFSNKQTPTIITISNGERYSGELSLKLQAQFPNTTITHLKDLIRLTFNKFKSEKKRDPTSMHSAVKLPGDAIGINVMYNDKEVIVRSEQCIAYLLKRLSLNKIKSFVVAIDPFSSDRERRSLLNAFKIANIQCPFLLNTTTAAAIA